MIKILAIDDKNDNLISLKAIIQDVFPDSILFTALNGLKGIELAIANDPDVILLDIVMPKMDGFEICRRLKANEPTSNIPVVFLTALGGDKKSRIKALEVGAEGFLSKPIDEIELTAQLNAMVKIRASNISKRNEQSRLEELVKSRTEALQLELEKRKKTEEILKESEKRFMQLFERAPMGYQSLDEDGHFIELNEAWLKTLGYNREEVLGKWFGDFLAPEYVEAYRTRFPIFKAQGQIHSEFEMIHRNGERKFIAFEGQIGHKEDGSFEKTHCILYDITEQKKTVASLRLSEERFRHISSSISDISYSCVIDSKGNSALDWFYGATEKITGYTSEELIALKCWGKLVLEDDFPIFKQHIVDLLPGTSDDCQLRLRKKDGKIIWVQASAKCVKAQNDSDCSILYGALVEITTRKQSEELLKESNQFNEFLLQTIPFGMDIVDEFGNILFISENLKKHLSKDLIGLKCWELYRDDQIQCSTCPLVRGITVGETDLYESYGVLGGKTFQISHTGMIFQGKRAMLEIFQDITEIARSREELTAAKELAEENSRLKTAFLNNMSHEIRTPMNHIMGFSSLMSEAKGEEKDSYAEIILYSSNQLLSLIEKVIHLSRLQSEKIIVNKQDFSPLVLITSIIETLQGQNTKKLVTLHIRVPEEYRHISILADMEKIKHILINLASNALKYTFEGNIELGFTITSGILTFFVKDTGIGIPIREHSKIFDSFYRGEQAISMVIGGTGLGLSIAKELVSAINSELELKSEHGKGSTFSFSLPILLSETIQIERQDSDKWHKSMKELSILIADDEKMNFLYLEILLKNSVKSIDHAFNGKIAIEMALENEYDLILMDLKMPEMDGFDATRQLKLKFPLLPIVAQTAFASLEDQEKALHAGCDDFIAKPIKKDALLEIIRKFI